VQEREACYKPLEDALLAHYSDIPFEERSENTLLVPVINKMFDYLRRRNFRILVPGAGLGRLAWNIANLGSHILSVFFTPETHVGQR
jgi:carnosine N-methyltransferase